MNVDDYTDLTLNNGTLAVFIGLDDWSRPLYKINHNGKDITLCCTEMDGTYLHTISADWGEPIAPVRNEFQPMNPQPEQTTSE